MQTPQMKNPADISNIPYSHPQGVEYDNNINKCEWCRSTLLSTCRMQPSVHWFFDMQEILFIFLQSFYRDNIGISISWLL